MQQIISVSNRTDVISTVFDLERRMEELSNQKLQQFVTEAWSPYTSTSRGIKVCLERLKRPTDITSISRKLWHDEQVLQDYEAESGVVVVKDAKRVAIEDALRTKVKSMGLCTLLNERQRKSMCGVIVSYETIIPTCRLISTIAFIAAVALGTSGFILNSPVLYLVAILTGAIALSAFKLYWEGRSNYRGLVNEFAGQNILKLNASLMEEISLKSIEAALPTDDSQFPYELIARKIVIATWRDKLGAIGFQELFFALVVDIQNMDCPLRTLFKDAIQDAERVLEDYQFDQSSFRTLENLNAIVKRVSMQLRGI